MALHYTGYYVDIRKIELGLFILMSESGHSIINQRNKQIMGYYLYIV